MNELASTELEESKTESITTHEKLEGLPLYLWGVCCHSLILLLLSFPLSLSCSCYLSRVYLYCPPFLPPSLPPFRSLRATAAFTRRAGTEGEKGENAGGKSVADLFLTTSFPALLRLLSPFPLQPIFCFSSLLLVFLLLFLTRTVTHPLLHTSFPSSGQSPQLLPSAKLLLSIRALLLFPFAQGGRSNQIQETLSLAHTHNQTHNTHTHTRRTHHTRRSN